MGVGSLVGVGVVLFWCFLRFSLGEFFLGVLVVEIRKIKIWDYYKCIWLYGVNFEIYGGCKFIIVLVGRIWLFVEIILC